MFIKTRKLLKHLTFIRKPVLVKRIVSGYYNTKIRKRDILRSIELAITYDCMLKCHKCYSANLYKGEVPNLSVNEIRDIVSEAMELGIIHINITGGEPLIRKDIYDIIRACQPDKIMVSLVTNAI
ncbi:unnamed protein product, partial [marine sediment metagenome]